MGKFDKSKPYNALPLLPSKKELLEIIFRLPYTKRKNLVEAKLRTPKTVSNYLLELEKIGILKSTRIGKERFYINHELI